MIKREKTVVNEIRNESVPVPLPPPPLPPPQSTCTKATDVIVTAENLVSKFFWTIIDQKKFPNLSIPYIVKKNDIKYLSVRIIERSILTKYENNYSEEVMRFGSLNSELCTQSDVVLLNEINDYHVNKEYGQEPFTLQDTIVQLDDFLKFYEILSRTCKTKEECSRLNSIRNNTVENKQIQQPTVGIQQKQDQTRLNIPDFAFNITTSSKNNSMNNHTHQNNNMTILQNQQQQQRSRIEREHPSFMHQTVISAHSVPNQINNSFSNNINRLNNEQNKTMTSSLTPVLSQQYSNNLIHTRHPSPIHPNANHTQFISSLIHQQQSPKMDYSRDLSPNNSLNHSNVMQRIHQPNQLTSNLNGNKNILPRIHEQPVNRHLQDSQFLGMRQNFALNQCKPPPLHPPSNIWPNHHQAEIFYNNNSVERNPNSSSPAYLVNENYNNRYTRISVNNGTVPSQPLTSPSSSQFNNSSNYLSQSNLPLQKQIHHNKAINQNHNILNALNTSSYPNQQSSSYQNRPISLAALQQNHHQIRNDQSYNLSLTQNQIKNNLINTNSPHSALNSPTPPLTPTPNNFLLSNLQAISPLSSNSQHQLTRHNLPSSSFINHAMQQNEISNQVLERSARSSVESNSSSHKVTDKSRKQHSSSINSTNEPDNDDCILLDETTGAPRRASNANSIRSSTDTNFENYGSGFLQLNDILVPYIRLPSRAYRCCSQYQPSNTYIPWETLAATGLIPKGNEIKLLNEFETSFTLEKSINPKEFKVIFDLLESLSPHYSLDNEKMVLINLLDLFSHCREALFLSHCRPGKQLISNYKEILGMTGGIVLIDIPDGPRDLLIFPFVNYSNMILAPLNTFTNYIKHFNPNKVDYSAATLNKEIYMAHFEEIKTIRHFLNLLLFYLTDNERKCKLPATIKLINIQPWLNRHPNEFKILCRYSSNFPSEWIENIDRVLIQFKLFTRTLSSNSETNSAKTPTQTSLFPKNSTSVITTAETPTIIQEPTNQIETITLSPSSMDSVTPSVSPFSSLNSIHTSVNRENEKIAANIVSTELSPKKALDKVEIEAKSISNSDDILLSDLDLELINDVICITKNSNELVPTLISSNEQEITQVNNATNETNEILNHNTEETSKSQPNESAKAIDNSEIEQKQLNETIEASEMIIAPLNFENIENSSQKSIEIESTEEHNQLVVTEPINKNDKTIVFDFDEDNHMTSYEIFKLKRRLSDSVIFYEDHAAFYKKYSSEEPNLVKEGLYDKKLDNKLEEFNNRITNNPNIEPKTSNINNFKNEPASPLINVPLDEQDTSINQLNENIVAKEQDNSAGNRLIKRNNSSTSSSIVSKRKKYSLNNFFSDECIETISDSDSLSSIGNKITKESIPKIENYKLEDKTPVKSSARKSTTFKPIKNWVKECDIYTTEEFDESFYLKKFNIQDCCVILENVGSDNSLPPKKLFSTFSNDSRENNDKIKKEIDETVKINQLKSGIRITSSASFADTEIPPQNTSSNNANISSLLQPLNFNQNNIKHSFGSLNIKHKENKQIMK